MEIRNFVIIAHVDHGKSTLADRLLEITGTIPARQMKPQYLDRLELERERGITIKMAPVRMLYTPQINADSARTDAENEQGNAENLLYGNITYKIRAAAFEVRKNLGLGHKESVYHNALAQEFGKTDLKFETEKNIGVFYDGKKVGSYRPDFVIEDKIIVELKALPEIGRPQTEQLWSYLKGSDYKLALLINFGSKELDIKRVIYDTARFQRNSASIPRESAQVERYMLNLIDTPGHSDFAYEVSRALLAVEGAILLVDVSKGIQAQTLSNFRLARQAGLKIIGAVNKIDLYPLRAEKTKISLAKLIGVQPEEIYAVSAKTGDGVKELLEGVVRQVPPPKDLKTGGDGSQALIFDSLYNDHKGVLAFSRVFSGEFSNDQSAVLLSSKRKFKIKETGFFTPDFKPVEKLSEGEIGYLATGLKEPNLIKIGDTIGSREAEPLIGFKEPQPVIFVSFYPTEQTTFEDLENGFKRLKLNDAALSFEKDSNEILGKGLKVGFLGELHFEITSERLEKEFNLEFLTTFPSVIYRVTDKNGSHFIKHPQNFTGDYFKIFQPMIKLEILTPTDYLNQILSLAKIFHLNILEIKNFSEDNLLLIGRMPLAELIKDFSDQLKSVSAGYASFSYDFDGEEAVDIGKLEILVANEPLPALTRLVLKDEVEREGRILVERLKDLLPQQQFSQALQAKAEGKIIARETIPAMRKELGNFGKNGGDRTRKMKLWKKQKRGKEKLQSMAKVKISAEIFRELLKK